MSNSLFMSFMDTLRGIAIFGLGVISGLCSVYIFIQTAHFVYYHKEYHKLNDTQINNIVTYVLIVILDIILMIMLYALQHNFILKLFNT